MAVESGHWVTIDEHPVFIRDDIGTGAKGRGGKFTRHALEKKLIEHHESEGGGVSHQDEKDLEASSGHPFVFHKSLPDEVKKYIEDNPAARRLFHVSQNAGEAGGADAMHQLGEDKYFEKAGRYAGSNLNAAIDSAKSSTDPEVRFHAALHGDLGPGAEQTKQGILPVGKLREGQSFKINGRQFHIESSADGLMLNGGHDFLETPVDALKEIPIDKGSLRASRKREVIPFSARQSTYALLLDADDRLSPITLANAPAADSEGNPIHYRRLPVAECKSWTHRGTGEPFTIDHARADEWQRNVAAMSTAGFKPFLTFKHTIDGAGQVYDPDARDTAGYVERIVREGDQVYADCSIYGDENLKIAARNSRSLCSVSRDMLDASGKKYTGETWHHLALVPNAALPNLGGTIKIAASASAPATSIPIYVLDSNQRTTMPLSAELATKARTTFNIGADVTDEKLADAVATKALALSADVTKLTNDLASAKTLALSANPKTYDDMTLLMLSESAQTKMDAALAAGVTPAVLTEIQGIYCVDGKPTGAALTLSAGRPVYFRVLEAVAKIKPVPLGAIPKAGLSLAAAIPSGETVAYDPKTDPQMQLMQQQTAGAQAVAK